MRAASVADGDSLLLVRLIEGTGHVMLFSKGGKCIRFPLANVPEYGRNARGNMGINLANGDIVVDAVFAPEMDEAAEDDEAVTIDDDIVLDDDTVLDDDDDEVDELDEADEAAVDDTETTLLTVTENGYGSRTPFRAYRVQGRNGKGIRSFRTGPTTGGVVGAVEVRNEDQLMLVTNTGRVIRISAKSVPVTVSRAVKGVRLMRLEDEEVLVDIERLEEPTESEEELAAEGVEGAEAEAETAETSGPDDDSADPSAGDEVPPETDGDESDA
jgi:DNA gyrase subunit A